MSNTDVYQLKIFLGFGLLRLEFDNNQPKTGLKLVSNDNF